VSCHNLSAAQEMSLDGAFRVTYPMPGGVRRRNETAAALRQVSVCISLCVYLRMYICIHAHTHTHTHTHVYVYKYMCRHVYIYIHIYTYIYICICTWIHFALIVSVCNSHAECVHSTNQAPLDFSSTQANLFCLFNMWFDVCNPPNAQTQTNTNINIRK